MSDSLDSYANLEELNKNFASFFERRNTEREPHVLEIIKRNNRETIMVNLLDFFIQDKYHDIGEKLYQNLLQCINNKSEKFDYGKLVSVKTEQSTEEKKRIDMVIETEKAIIMIEAKVNHVLNNNLVIYAEYANKLKKEKNKKHLKKIILSKWPSNSLESFRESKEQEESQIEESKEWIEISWEDVLDEGLSPSNEPYKSLYNSMVKSMKGDEYLEKNELEVAKGNFEQIAKTFEFAKTVFKLQEEKTKKLAKVVQNKFTKGSEPKIKIYSKPFEEGAFVPRVYIENEQKKEYVIDICVDIRGYQFVILKRDNDVNEDDVRDLVKELGYDVKQFNDPTEKEDKRLIIHNKEKKKSEYLFKNNDAQTKIADYDYSGIAEFAHKLYGKINQKS